MKQFFDIFLIHISVVLAAYKWLLCYLLQQSSAELKRQTDRLGCRWKGACHAQVYYCRTLALAFIEVRGVEDTIMVLEGL